MIKLLSDLCALDAVPGYEQEVRNYISEKAAPFATEIFTDPLGSLFVFKKGQRSPSRPIMLCAHMDEVGFLVKSITEDGMLKIVASGGIDPRVLIGRKMQVGKNKITGIISLKAIHLTTIEERKKAPELKTLYIDIGANDRESAEKLVRVGDYAVFDSEFATFGEDCIKGKALDDRIGCAILLRLLERELAYDCWFVFTTGEEIGARGAMSVIDRLDPGSIAVIDSTPASDVPDNPSHLHSTKMRNGAAVYLIDRGAIYDRTLRQRITAAADRECIKWQYRTLVGGSTDASAYVYGTGAKLFGLSVPTRYLHCANSVAYLPDIYAVEKMAGLFIEEAGAMNV